jgi:transcriptional regulator with XRE-family HTH domain
MSQPPTLFRKRRIDLGMTQQDLAARCTTLGAKVGDSQISKIERALCAPYPKLRSVLRELLGDDPVDLQKPWREDA